MKILAFLLLNFILLFANDIKPIAVIKTDSVMLDLTLKGTNLYSSSSKGDIYEIGQGKLKKLCSLPKITTPYNDQILQKALTLDISENSQIAIGAQDGNMYFCQNNTLSKSGFKTDAIIKKVAYISQNSVLILLISGQVVLFDTEKNKQVYSAQISNSPLGDFAISADKQTAAIVGEAGYVFMFDIKNGRLKATYKNVNLDNIYKVSYKNKMILTAGQDRKATLLKESGEIVAKLNSEFLVYGCALNDSATKAVYSCSEQNDICIYDIASKNMTIAKGSSATINRIVFFDDKKFASVADENKILIWSTK